MSPAAMARNASRIRFERPSHLNVSSLELWVDGECRGAALRSRDPATKQCVGPGSLPDGSEDKAGKPCLVPGKQDGVGSSRKRLADGRQGASTTRARRATAHAEGGVPAGLEVADGTGLRTGSERERSGHTARPEEVPTLTVPLAES